MTRTVVPGAPIWVDLGSTDLDGAVDFYGGLLGWTSQDLGPEAGGYRLLFKDGKQVAGLGPATDPTRGSSWSTYFATDDADETVRRVKDAGGQVIVDTMDVMGLGKMAVFVDLAGAFFSCWQPLSHRGSEIWGEVGSVAWCELMSTDIAAVKPFYGAVLGVDLRDVPIGNDISYTLLERNGDALAGAMPTQGEGQPSAWTIYFEVEDCDVSNARALELGASQIMPPSASPAGRFAVLADPQGAPFAIIKGDPDFSM